MKRVGDPTVTHAHAHAHAHAHVHTLRSGAVQKHTLTRNHARTLISFAD